MLRDEFRALLKSAVARQLDGGKAGCFLSGGTDSSTVAGMIGQVLSKPAATYSIGFEAEGYDEMAFARMACKAIQYEASRVLRNAGGFGQEHRQGCSFI